ncbi:MAG TPA: AI-2E family transporter [Acidimicrobiales bacterium]|nr:AI-2E family transporter [Acidimicrobiales bacterium]
MTSSRPLDRAASFTGKSLVVAAGVALVVLALARLRLLVLPMIVALLLATALVPPVRWLQRIGVPRLVATWLVLLAGAAALVGLVVGLAPSVAEEFRGLGPTVEQGVRQVENWLVEGPLALSGEEIDRYTDQVVDQLRTSGARLASGLLAGAVVISEVIAGLLLIVVLTFFFVKDGEEICAFGLRQLREEHHDLARAVARRGWAALGSYVRGTAAVAVVDAVIIGVGLVLIGVPLVAPLVLLTFFGAFLPLVGAVAAGAVAVLVALVSGGPTDALLTLGVVVLVQQVEGDVVAPLVLGRAVRLHPVVILAALTGGAVIGGLIGAFLAVPAAAVAVAVGSELKARGVIGPLAPAPAPAPAPPPSAAGHTARIRPPRWVERWFG